VLEGQFHSAQHQSFPARERHESHGAFDGKSTGKWGCAVRMHMSDQDPILLHLHSEFSPVIVLADFEKADRAVWSFKRELVETEQNFLWFCDDPSDANFQDADKGIRQTNHRPERFFDWFWQ
jgi:hypothetical protein